MDKASYASSTVILIRVAMVNGYDWFLIRHIKFYNNIKVTYIHY